MSHYRARGAEGTDLLLDRDGAEGSRDVRAPEPEPQPVRRSIGKDVRDLAVCLLLAAIFFDLAVGAVIVRGLAIPGGWWLGLVVGHVALAAAWWRGFVRKDARAELRGIVPQRFYLSLPLLITAAHVVAKLPYLGAVPRWSTGIYYAELVRAVVTLDFFAHDLATTYRLGNHPSHAYSMYLAVGQILAAGWSRAGLPTPAALSYGIANVQDLLLAAAGVWCFWLLVARLFPALPRAQAVLLTLCFAFNPLVFALGLGPNTDLPITVALIVALMAFAMDRPALVAFAGLWMCFSKESGALMYAELWGLLVALYVVQRFGPPWGKLDVSLLVRRVLVPLLPLVVYAVYLRSTSPLVWVERSTALNDKADPVLSPAFGLSWFQLETGLVSALLHNWNWIPTLAVVALLAKRQMWPRIAPRLTEEHTASLLRAIAWLFAFGVAFACLYIKDNHPRYYAPLIPLMLILFYYALSELVASTRVRTAVLAMFFAVGFGQIWASLDPVGNAIWGTFAIGDRKVMFIQRGLQGQADGMVFNAQHQAVSRLYTRLNKEVFAGGQRPTLIFGIDHHWVVNYAEWGLRLDERTAEYTYKARGSFAPDRRTIGQIDATTAPAHAVYVALPWLENPTVTLEKLQQFYRLTGEKVIADGGYFITAYELAR